MRVTREPDPRYPVNWKIETDDGEYVGEAYPRVYAECDVRPGPCTYKRDLKRGLDYRIHDADYAFAGIGIETFDWAVPINEDHTYPYGGQAVTVYRSTNGRIPTGIVPYDTLWNEFFRQAAELIAHEWENAK